MKTPYSSSSTTHMRTTCLLCTVYYLLVVAPSAVHAAEFLNLAATRAAARTKPMHEHATHALYNRFQDPLPADIIAPLCGNGRLDTFDDYLKLPGFMGSDRIYVHEACDDGNRLDGDGCAADCTSMDAPTAPCPLAIDPLLGGEPIVAMTFFSPNATTNSVDASLWGQTHHSSLLSSLQWVVFTPTRLFRWNSIDLTLISITDFAIGPVVSAFQSNLNLFVYGGGRVWVPLQPHATNGSFYQPLKVQDSPVGIWLTDRRSSRNRYLVTAAGDIVNVDRRLVTNWTNTAAEAASLYSAVIRQSSDTSLFTVDCTFNDTSSLSFDLETATHMVLAGSITVRSAPMVSIFASEASVDALSGGGYPWLYFVIEMLATGARVLPVPDMIFSFSGQQSGSNERWDTDTYYTVSDIVIGFNVMSARTFLTSDSQFVGLGESSLKSGFTNAVLCNGTEAPCLLDVPLCYNLLSPNNVYHDDTNPQQQQQKQTFFTAFDNASRTSTTLPETFRKADLRCKNPNHDTTPITQILVHPISQALWIARGNMVYEVGRRGTQVRHDAQIRKTCMPSMSGACASGYWSPPRLGCVPCSSFSLKTYGSVPGAVAAYTQQCATSISSRRLLLQATVPREQHLEFTLGSNVLTTIPMVIAFIAPWGSSIACRETTAGGVWGHVYICTLGAFNDPSAVLRNLKAAVAPNVTDFVSPPSLVWTVSSSLLTTADHALLRNDSTTTTTTTTTTGSDTPAVAGIIMGGMLLALAMLLGVYLYLHHHYHKQPPQVIVAYHKVLEHHDAHHDKKGRRMMR
jgi:cysteine-rich repeat protein